MPNFTSQIKRDIISSFPASSCCGKATISALLTTSGTVAEDQISFVSENEKIAEHFVRLMESVFFVRPEVKGAVFDPKRERDKLTFSYGGEKLGKILPSIGYPNKLDDITRKDCCALSYIKGAFLGGGSCTLPHGGVKTGYHLEFVFPSRDAAEQFGDLLMRFELLCKVIDRGEKSIVYFKSGDVISDFFSVIGAESALKKLEDVAAARAESNNENRISNCFAGNADKAAIASANQVLLLERMQRDGRLSELSQQQQQVALARLANKEDSLAELAPKLGISKSCLNHRMRKIIEIYKRTYDHD